MRGRIEGYTIYTSWLGFRHGSPLQFSTFVTVPSFFYSADMKMLAISASIDTAHWPTQRVE